MDRSSPVTQLRATVGGFAKDQLPAADRWCVALSGGADSLALTAVAAELLPTTALIVDHGLQPGSAAAAQTAQRQALALGCVGAEIIPVTVGTAGGPEAAARSARYAALETARAGAPVLIGHTLDDQAETVLLGLGRGSGPRSIAGIRPFDPPWCRPLLQLRRATTEAACAALGLTPWRDPHNDDRRFTRTRLRHGAAAARGRARRRGRRGAGAHGHRAAGGRRRPRRTGRPGAGRGPTPHRRPADRRRGGAAAAVRLRALRSWLLAAGRAT